MANLIFYEGPQRRRIREMQSVRLPDGGGTHNAKRPISCQVQQKIGRFSIAILVARCYSFSTTRATANTNRTK